MATKQLLIKSLQRPYDRILFAKDVLNPVFGSGFTLFSEPVLSHEQPNNTELQVIQEPVYKYGEIVLEDGTEVNCFEITLQPKVRIEQSRVAIQHFVRKLLTAGQAALVNFISPSTDNIWRLTLVAKDSEITEDGIKEKTTHSKRYTYLVEKDRPNRTLAERLEHLSLETVIDFEALVKAFSVETMSKEFFDEYKHHYQNFVEYLTGKRTVKEKGKWVEKKVSKASPFLVSIFNGNEKDARDFNKKLLGRIVFLYFVQKKRWLGAKSTDYTDGSYDFIYQLFEETGGDTRFFPVGLTELFFNVLNKERLNDDYTTPTGDTVKIPYLNGGLFNRDEVDEILHKKGDLMTFPPHLFSNPDLKDVPYERGFLDFLNAYNFTVYEDSPNDHTVAVDPEMLGHIFENLLEDNKDKGAYYTPKEIVSYMCRESLTEYLVTHLNKEYKVYREIGNNQVELFGNEVKTGQLSMIEEFGDKALNRKDVEQIVKDKSIDGLTDKQLKRINQLLDDVKICDPAIGSGAFPMGLLQEIFTVKEMIAHELHWDWKPDEVKEHIIQNSIYGVDIEKGAVDIARLRFWLSLIVDIEKPKALPNLDYKIVVGDSLVSKVKIDGIEEIVEINWDLKSSVGEADKYVKNIQSLLKDVVEKQTKFFNPNVKNKTKLKQEIRNLKIRLLINQLKFEKEKFQSRSASMDDMFDNKKTIEQVENEIRISGFNTLVSKLDKLLKQPDKPFVHFDWMLDFPEILNSIVIGKDVGFDIVIANPPYIGQKGNKKLFEPFKSSSKWKPFYERKQDIYYYFIAQGIKLLAVDGFMSFINPPYFLTAEGASTLRSFIIKNSSITKILNLSETINVFENVSINNLILFLSNGSKRNTEKIELYTPNSSTLKVGLRALNLDYSKFSTSELSDSEWYLFKDKNTIELDTENTILLGDVATISPGIQTGSDKVSDSHINKYGLTFLTKGQGIYVLSDKEYKSIELTEKEKSIVKPFFKNSQIHKWVYDDKNYEWVIITNDIDDIDEYPNIKEHLSNYRTILDKRYRNFALKNADKEGRWWYLYGYRPYTNFEGEKIILPYRSLTNTFAYSNKPIYSSIDVFYIDLSPESNLKLKYILSILCSKLIEYWLGKNCKKKGKVLELYQKPLSKIPIVTPKNEYQNTIVNIANYVLFLKELHFDLPEERLITSYFEQVIDGIVYELYFPELLKKHNREIIQHLGDLPELTDGMSDDEKMKICKDVFNRLDDKSHPVRNNLFYMNSIPEIRIIEGKDS